MSDDYRYLYDQIAFVLREIGKGITLAAQVTFVLVVIGALIKFALIMFGTWPS